MKNVTLKLAVLGALCASMQAGATGLVSLAATGATASSAYLECYALGQTSTVHLNNYGSSGTATASTTANNNCATFPANDATAPVSGFTLVASATRNVVINNTYTNNTNVQVGQVFDRVWRNAAATECIYGAKFVPASTDYQPLVTGTQYFEANDIARGGFSASGTVQVGYYAPSSSTTSPTYRIGRTYTSVQHRAVAYDNLTNKSAVGSGYVSLPPSASGSTASINGVNTPIAAGTISSATAAQQTAAVNANWIDFTVDAVYGDDDGSTNPISSNTYVQAACTSAAPVAVNDAIRIRQTAQEFSNFIEASVPGFVPPGGTATPAPVVPF